MDINRRKSIIKWLENGLVPNPGIERIPYDHLSRSQNSSNVELYEKFYLDLPSNYQRMLEFRNESLEALWSLAERHIPHKIYSDQNKIIQKTKKRMPPRLISRPSAFHIYREQTSGSSGRPLEILRPSKSLHRETLRWHYVNGIYSDLGRAPDVILYVSHYSKSRPYVHLDQTTASLLTIKTNISDLKKCNIRLLNDVLSPFVLSGTPSSLVELKDSIDASNIRPSYIQLAGEECPPRIEESLTGAFHARCFRLIASREFGLLAFQCPGCGSYHLLESDFEFSSSTDKDIIITDATNDHMLFLNYCTGDKGLIVRQINACNLPWPSMRNFSGRPYGKKYQPPEYDGRRMK